MLGKARKHHFFNCIRLQLIAEHLQAACLHPFWKCKSGLRASPSTYGSWEFFASMIVLFETHCVKRTVVHSLSLKHSYILPSCHKVNVFFTEQPPRVYGLLKLCIFACSSVEWVYLAYLASGLEASYKSARAYLVSPPGPT